VSPYEAEARYATKRTTSWVGYKVHLTETCEDDRPHLITDVGTTIATPQAVDQLGPLPERLGETRPATV
jgi:transposase